jgi:hypothetical protein
MQLTAMSGRQRSANATIKGIHRIGKSKNSDRLLSVALTSAEIIV